MSLTVFLTEEPSAKAFLDAFIPRKYPDWLEGRDFRVIAFSGKSDLMAKIPAKLRGWSDARFVILHDKDANDCLVLKQQIRDLCRQNGQPGTLIRIVCRELESWYLGDLAAVAQAFNRPQLGQQRQKSKFRQPDDLGNPKQELKKILPEYTQIAGSQRIGLFLSPSPEDNSSTSFRVFLSGLDGFIIESPRVRRI